MPTPFRWLKASQTGCSGSLLPAECRRPPKAVSDNFLGQAAGRPRKALFNEIVEKSEVTAAVVRGPQAKTERPSRRTATSDGADW